MTAADSAERAQQHYDPREVQGKWLARWDGMDLFRASVQTWPEVVECAALTGDMDYLLRVVVADMAHYSRFIMDTLLKHPSVEDCKTSFVLDRVKATTAVPV